jgi:signal transduction histidine kinase
MHLWPLSTASPQPGPHRALLLAGFGGLLLMMAFAGIDGLRVLGYTRTRSAEIQQGFLNRSNVLDQIRSDLYLAGTYARDYLTDPQAADAQRYRAELNRLREEMDDSLDTYRQLMAPSEQAPLDDLRQHITDYWSVIEPTFQWTRAERQARGFDFMRDEIQPRRMAMLELASQIEVIDDRQVNAANQRVAALFAGFRTRLIVTLAVTLALGLLLAGFTVQRLLELERHAAQRYQEVVEARAELEDLSARLVAAQEEERRALSRELHDEVGQTLSALLVGLSNLGAAIQAGRREQVERGATELRLLAETSVASVRNIALLLRPSMLDDLGLVPALEWQAREMSRRTGILVNVAATGVPEDLTDEYKTCIYRVVQEALHNVERHAGAQSVRVVLHGEATRLLLSIQDDGRGFDPRRHRGLGLLGMQERVAHLGGSFRAGSEPGSGTRVDITLPLPALPERPSMPALATR